MGFSSPGKRRGILVADHDGLGVLLSLQVPNDIGTPIAVTDHADSNHVRSAFLRTEGWGLLTDRCGIHHQIAHRTPRERENHVATMFISNAPQSQFGDAGSWAYQGRFIHGEQYAPWPVKTARGVARRILRSSQSDHLWQ